MQFSQQNSKADEAGAEQLFKRALAVDPSDRPTLHVYGCQLLDVWGKRDEAEALFRRSLQIDEKDVNVLRSTSANDGKKSGSRNHV